MAANTANVKQLAKKNRNLSGIPEFYNGLYSDWDAFMTQNCDPSRQSPSVSAGRRNTVNIKRPVPRTSGLRSSNPVCQRLSSRPAAETDKDNVAAGCQSASSVSNQPTVASNADAASEISAVNTDISAAGKTPQSGTELSGYSSGPEHGLAAENDARATRLRPTRSRSVVLAATGTQLLADDDATAVLDAQTSRRKLAAEAAGYEERLNKDIKLVAKKKCKGRQNTLRRDIQLDQKTSTSEVDCTRRRRRKGDVDLVSMKTGDDFVSVKRRRRHPRHSDEDIKPVIGAVEVRRTCGKTRQSRRSVRNGRKNSVEDNGTGSARFQEQDVKPDLSTLAVNAHHSEDLDHGMTQRLRSGRSRKSATSQVDDNVDTVEMRQTDEKQSGHCSRNGRKDSVEDNGDTASARFEEQDVKPDLSTLSVTVPSAEPDHGMTRSLRSGRSRKSDTVHTDDNVEAVEIRRTDEKQPRQSARNGIKDSVEDNGTGSAWFEEQDVKPDLSTLNVAVPSEDQNNGMTRSLPSGRSRKSDSGAVEMRRKDRKPNQSRWCGRSNRKDSVVVHGETASTGFEEQDVKPDLTTLNVNVPSEDLDHVTRNVGSRRSRKSDTGRVDNNVDIVEMRQINEKPKQSRQSARNGRNDTVEDNGTGSSRFEEEDVKPDLSSLALHVQHSMELDQGMTRTLRSGRSIIYDTHHVDDNVDTVEIRQKEKRPNLSRQCERSSRKDSVEFRGETASIEFEEQDVKPDLSTLNVTVREMELDDDTPVKTPNRSTRGNDCSVDRFGLLSPSTGTENSVEVATEIAWTGFEEQDVKPNLASLAEAAVSCGRF